VRLGAAGCYPLTASVASEQGLVPQPLIYREPLSRYKAIDNKRTTMGGILGKEQLRMVCFLCLSVSWVDSHMFNKPETVFKAFPAV